jgi:hypothetical protein
MLIKNKRIRTKTKRLLQLTASSECEPEDVLSHMEALYRLLSNEEITLTTPEKMIIVKSMARAKVRAHFGGASDNYKKLDSIGSDLIQLL